MSLRIDSTEWLGGSLLIGETGLGVLGSAIPSTGDSGCSYLYNDLTLPADNGKEICGRITTWPTAGTLTAYEDGSFTFAGAPNATYSFAYQLYVDGVATGTPATVTLLVGATVTAVTSDATASYLLRTSATASTSAAYAVRGTVSVDSTPAYSVRAEALKDLTASYSIRSFAVADSSLSYSLRGGTAITADTLVSYTILAASSLDLQQSYSLKGTSYSDLILTYYGPIPPGYAKASRTLASPSRVQTYSSFY